MGSGDLHRLLTSAFRYYAARTTNRLAGLTDDEYFWEHDERLGETMGPEAGPFASDSVAGFVEHIHDEFIHHSAEVALLRDLYRARSAQTPPP